MVASQCATLEWDNRKANSLLPQLWMVVLVMILKGFYLLGEIQLSLVAEGRGDRRAPGDVWVSQDKSKRTTPSHVDCLSFLGQLCCSKKTLGMSSQDQEVAVLSGLICNSKSTWQSGIILLSSLCEWSDYAERTWEWDPETRNPALLSLLHSVHLHSPDKSSSCQDQMQ